jgi:hypothetical protein
MIDSGIINGWLNICFNFLRESVTRVILSTRECAGDRDHPHLRSAKWTWPRTIGRRDQFESIEAGFVGDIVFKAHQHDLGRIDDGSASHGDDQIRFRFCGVRGCLHCRRSRRMLRDAVEGAGISATQRLADLFDLVGLRVQRSADNEEDALGVAPFGLLAQSLARWLAEDHLIHRRILMKADFCHANSPFMAFARSGFVLYSMAPSP